MPQHDLFDRPKVTGVRIDVEDLTVNLEAGFTLTARVQHDGGDYRTLIAQRWHGVMVDMLADTCQAAMVAFLWGEDGDVARALIVGHRQAKKHAKSRERL